ncbi:MAG: phosphoribosylformylglycinamidine synthase [Bacteroidales bacterium]|nr:phosphoribosylformylglycinamidine synthase [Bacteroidales bacterium]
MILFFRKEDGPLLAVQVRKNLTHGDVEKLSWLFGRADLCHDETVTGLFIGPRKEMITPWSTNAVEMAQNMGVDGIDRIEQFIAVSSGELLFDPMLQARYNGLDQHIFTIDRIPDPVMSITNIHEYNDKEGLALSDDEIRYLENLGEKLGRSLTDSEIFGFSQVNSEHCRHKIFNGSFIIDGIEQELSLFQLIKATTLQHRNRVVSAYKDNCAFLMGPEIFQFAPEVQDKPDFFRLRKIQSIISLKAETHNFPTTVEPFNGAATGTGGEIRDRIGGGRGAIPLAGTAVYMTSYPRLSGGRIWEKNITPRKWLYQTPEQILIKASNGASDFGNKFGQPLICGSVLTFEYCIDRKLFAFDKVIMLAGGIGSGNAEHAEKNVPEKGDRIVLLGGDNYRIGMGGGAVSSVATGEYGNHIELNAVQRSNPEMQKRVYNAIRALAESIDNPVVSIHDHGAGGHLNCLSELVEQTGGFIEMEKLPVGDPTMSAKEIIGNESQERMGLVMKEDTLPLIQRIAERERAPLYVIGEVTGDHQFTFVEKDGSKPIDLQLKDMFGNPPKTIMRDETSTLSFPEPGYTADKFNEYLEQVLQLEGVACKDWLTNKVDRCVTGRIAKQQTCGTYQLPLNNVAVATLDYSSCKGVATALGHAPAAGLINPESGSVLAIAESLTNIVWAPIEEGLSGISLSANWMWPCKNPGEDARLYSAVKAASDFAISLGINIPTGKDSLSMTQKYPDGTLVFSPGTVIISAAGEVTDIHKTVEPVLNECHGSRLLYIDMSGSDYFLGGSSFAQVMNALGNKAPSVTDPRYFKTVFNTIQSLVVSDLILAGHDISAGGMIVALLEMTFSCEKLGLEIDLSPLPEHDIIKLLFSEKPGLVFQIEDRSPAINMLKEMGIQYYDLGIVVKSDFIKLKKDAWTTSLDIRKYRDIWYKTSYLLDCEQSGHELAQKRYDHYKEQPVWFRFPDTFSGRPDTLGIDLLRMSPTGTKAAIIREKGVNGDREMAYIMHLAGFDVKDVHMTDLISGRETLEDISFIVFVGGFSNSDVLGSAKGWAGAFLNNEKARIALDNFYNRQDTLSLGVCNGCQLMIELGLITSRGNNAPVMLHNTSGKFECAFLNVDVPESNAIMLKTLNRSRLGIWVAHGEGRFRLSGKETNYNIALRYSYAEYPGNPNGSDYNAAGICSVDGRHLAVMPHLERATFPWNWAVYPENRSHDQISPWVEAFVNARKWINDTVSE